MSESAAQFREWCLGAFAFLREQYGFVEVEPNEESLNPYYVRFSNGEIGLEVKGEGYGTIAYVGYVNREGLEVPSKFLEPNWDPLSFRKKRRKRGPALTQEQQIISEAERIKGRDGDILGGDYTRLDEVAMRWKDIREKLFGRRA